PFFPVQPDKVPDIRGDGAGGLIDAGMTVTEHIGLQRQEFFHGAAPRNRIAVKFLEEGGADVLAEEDPRAAAIGIQGDGTWGMARYMKKGHVLAGEGDLAPGAR